MAAGLAVEDEGKVGETAASEARVALLATVVARRA